MRCGAVVVVWCSALQCVAVCCSVLQCVTVRNAHILPAAVDKTDASPPPPTEYVPVAVCCNLAVCCSVLQCAAVEASLMSHLDMRLRKRLSLVLISNVTRIKFARTICYLSH